MREIKFREWDSRKMRPWESINFYHMYVVEDLAKGDVFEQYTGLKDVNGIEVRGYIKPDELIILGNIHENPELLEGE